MRILYCIDGLRTGGKERQFIELVKTLAKLNDIELFIVCMGEEDFFLSEIEKTAVPFRFIIRKIRWDPFVFVQLYKTVRYFRPDIIHTNNWVSSFYALPIAKVTGAILINGSIRNAFPPAGLRWWLEKIILGLSGFRVANSKAGLESRGFSINSKRNYVVYNGFDFSRIRNVSEKEITKFPWMGSGKKVIGMVATFKDHKDYESYILAAKKVIKKRNDVVFLAVGDGKNLEVCKKMIPNNLDGIKFLGLRKDIDALVSTFDIGVLSTYTEGISNSIMEYMAFGKPVIATDGGGTKEIVVDGNTGFLVQQKKPDILASKIEYLLDNPNIVKKYGCEGRKRIEKEFSLDRLVKDALNLYELAIKYKI